MNDKKKDSNLVNTEVFQAHQERRMKENAFRLEAFNKTKRFFQEVLAGSHHRINNLLQSVNSDSTMFLDSESLSEEEKDALIDNIQNKVIEVDNVLTELRHMFEEDDENAPLTTKHFHEILDEVEDFCENRFNNHNISFDASVEDFELECQPRSLSKAILAILTSSHQAIHDNKAEDRWISVTSENDHANFVNIVISDSAEKIDEDDVNDLFTPFYTTKDKRNCMSLALAKLIIENQGGSLYLDDSKDDNTFVVQLPRVTATSSAGVVHLSQLEDEDLSLEEQKKRKVS